MKKEKICCIYKITNKINGKVYIGQSRVVESYDWRIGYLEELIHTCSDELEWLEMKVGTGPFEKNMFEFGAFDFEPNKNHA